MRKTQVVELFANIRATFVSFFSIVMFVALGVAVFLGLRWGSKALTSVVNETLRRQNAPDIEISYPYGITDADLVAMQVATTDIADIEAGYVTFAQTSVSDMPNTMRVQQLTGEIAVPDLVSGTLPVAGDEVAVLDIWATRNNVSVGDVIELSEDSQLRYLAYDSYRVVGTVTSSDYLCRETSTYGVSTTGSGSVDGVAFCTADAFNSYMYLGAYPMVFVRLRSCEGLSSFTDAYRQHAVEAITIIDELGRERSPERFETVTEMLELIVAYGREAVDLYPELLAEYDVSAEEADALITQGSAMLGTLRDTGWITLGRTGNGGLLYVSTFQSVLMRMCWSMASLFVVVGLLVCYSAVSRIVYEQVTQVGTKKALGLYRLEITRGYLAYSATAVILGTVIGAAAAYFIVQGILNPSLASAYVMGSYPAYFSLRETLIAGAVELTLILLATWLSCRDVLSKRAVDLLQGGSGAEGRHRFFERLAIWKRLPLLAQMIVNNCLNDKRRVIATLVGVAGCTALVVSALTLQNDVLASFDKQYATEYGFDSIVTPKAGNFEGAKEALAQVGSTSAPVLRRMATLSTGPGDLSFGYLIVPADDSFGDVYHMHTSDGSGVDLSTDGVWVTEGLADKAGAKVGDMVWVRGPGGVEAEVEIAGFYSYYLIGIEMVMGPETYMRLFGEAATPNVLLADGGGRDAQTLLAEVDASGTVAYITNYRSRTRQAFRAFQKLSQTVVMLYVALATLMAIVVLLNLYTMFIQEKRKELTVLMVLGFPVGDAKAYVRNDSIFLTVVGIVLGIVLGSAVGYLTVRTIEPLNSIFIRTPNLEACLIGAAVSAMLSAIMGFIALRQVPRFSLTDITRF